MSGRQGFTLVEIIMAVMIFSFMMGGVDERRVGGQ